MIGRALNQTACGKAEHDVGQRQQVDLGIECDAERQNYRKCVPEHDQRGRPEAARNQHPTDPVGPAAGEQDCARGDVYE